MSVEGGGGVSPHTLQTSHPTPLTSHIPSCLVQHEVYMHHGLSAVAVQVAGAVHHQMVQCIILHQMVGALCVCCVFTMFANAPNGWCIALLVHWCIGAWVCAVHHACQWLKHAGPHLAKTNVVWIMTVGCVAN